MNCPECKVGMIRRPSKFGKEHYWWGCSNYPDCKITSAEHPDGTMMSTPADQATKDLRKEIHKLAEKLFGEWYDKDARKQMYEWLKANTKTGHIGLMGKSELQELKLKLAK